MSQRFEQAVLGNCSRQGGSEFKIKLPQVAINSGTVFTLYAHTGKKVLEKTLSPAPSSQEIAADKIFDGNVRLAAGYYFYQIRDSESASEIFSMKPPTACPRRR